MDTRRSVLAGVGAGVAALAGCLGGDTGTTTRTERDGWTASPTPDADPNTLRALEVAGSPGGPVTVLPDEVTLLDYWATWCAPCKPQMAELRTVRDRFPELHMLSITNERDGPAIRSFWREYEGTWPVARDTDLVTNERFGVTRMPTLLVFDADGAEVWRHVGLAAADSVLAAVERARG
jgi:thiol-disulfide isomerase/thioredoxin